MNIEVFGSLLKNAIVRHDCSYIINLMNRAIELELTLDEKALLSLAEFKSTVTSRMAKSVSRPTISYFLVHRILVIEFN